MNLKNLFSLLVLSAGILASCGSQKSLSTSSQTDLIDPGFGPQLQYVPGGHFEMGGSMADDVAYTNDVQKREMQISQFYMDRHEVTNADWKLFVADAGAEFLPDSTLYWSAENKSLGTIGDYYNDEAFADYPVVGITWEQAVAYCDWRTQKVRQSSGDASIAPFRLPTEEEWEYASISISSTVPDEITTHSKSYPWHGDGLRYPDNNPNQKAYHGQYLANFQLETKGVPPIKPVGNYWPNDFYLFDMAGNVNEWVADQYQQIPTNADGESSSVASSLYGHTTLVNEKSRVYKGGSWDDLPHWLVPATRRHFQQDQASSTIGFRTVQSTHVQQRSFRGQKSKPSLIGKPLQPIRR